MKNYIFTLKENDEYRFKNLVPGIGILQRVLDLCNPEEDVASAGSPQHFLEGGQPLTEDHACYESKL